MCTSCHSIVLVILSYYYIHSFVEMFELDTLIGLFMTAALQGDWDRARAILADSVRNHTLCLTDELGWSMLHHVADFHHVRNIAQRLDANGSSSNSSHNNTIRTTQNDPEQWNDRHLCMIQLLLEHPETDTLWETRDLRDATNALHVACSSGVEPLVLRTLMAHAQKAGYRISSSSARQEEELTEEGDRQETMMRRKNLYTTPDGDNRTLLHVAAEHGHSDIVEELLRYHHDTQEAPPEHQQRNDHHETTTNTTLTSSHTTVDPRLDKCQPSHKTPLHLACEWGHLEVVQTLISWTPPSSAAAACRQERIHLLLDMMGAQDDRGETPLHTALQCGYLSCVRQMLQALHQALTDKKDGSDDPLAEESTIAVLHQRIRETLGLADLQGDTILHFLARRFHDDSTARLRQTDVAVCRMLLSLGMLQHHSTAFTSSSRTLGDDDESQNASTRTLLLLPAITNNRGETALHEACRRGNLHVEDEIRAQLKDNRITDKVWQDLVNLPNARGWTALMLSLQHSNIFHRLLEGIHVNLQQREKVNGDTTLYVAIRESAHFSTFVALLERDAGLIHERNNRGHTPLVMAATKNMFQAVHLMVSYSSIEVLDSV